MFTSTNDTRKDQLEATHKDWDVWYVLPVYGATTWHARPKGARTATLNAGSAEGMDKLLSSQPAPEGVPS